MEKQLVEDAAAFPIQAHQFTVDYGVLHFQLAEIFSQCI